MADGKNRSVSGSGRPYLHPMQRPWKRTAYGKHFHYNRNSQAFVVMSYNILSQDNVEKQRQLYNNHIECTLAWSHRFECLKREIESVRPTILCLQEVQDTHLHEIADGLLSLNYNRPLFKKRNGEQSDGCAIFYNRNLFKLIDHHFVEFFQPQIDVSVRRTADSISRKSHSFCCFLFSTDFGSL